jgi:SAM-dependent methyltransferase
MGRDKQESNADRVAQQVSDFYERHPYPPPVDSLERYRALWNDDRRRAEVHLFWPCEPYRDDRHILIAGCGTSQAAKYALAWPRAKVTGIDVSATSIQRTEKLKLKYELHNLEVHQLPVERAEELGSRFELVVCTGVLHHLPNPDVGLRALRRVLEPGGAMHLMVYAPYGRAGIYLLQEYCRRLGIGTSAQEIKDLANSLTALPPNHPLVPLLRDSPDFRQEAALADALLHPQDRAYSVPQLLDFLAAGGLQLGRWVRQAPYLPQCGALASTPHQALLARLPLEQQYAAVELFRGSMVRHSVVAYGNDRPTHPAIDFAGDAWPAYVPIRLPDTVVVRERLPPGAAAVLINQNHSFTDLYLPIDAQQKMMFDAIDGKRSIRAIFAQTALRDAARILFERLWRFDQVVFDAGPAPSTKAKKNADHGMKCSAGGIP